MDKMVKIWLTRQYSYKDSGRGGWGGCDSVLASKETPRPVAPTFHPLGRVGGTAVDNRGHMLKRLLVQMPHRTSIPPAIA